MPLRLRRSRSFPACPGRFGQLAVTRCRSISWATAGGSEFTRTFDQSAFPFCLFAACNGLVRQPVNRSPCQFGGRCRQFAGHHSPRIHSEGLLHKSLYGFGAGLAAMFTPPSIDLPQHAPRQCHVGHDSAGGAVTARSLAVSGCCRSHRCGLPSPPPACEGSTMARLATVRVLSHRVGLFCCLVAHDARARFWRWIDQPHPF